MGHALINPQLIADQFAANGYWVVMPDLFQGDAIELNQLGTGNFDIMTWLTKGGPEGKGHLPDTVDPIVEKTLAYMKEQGAKKIGAVGYCFGGKYVARFLAKGKGVDVGFTAHPSFVDEAELRGMTGPLSIAAAGKLRKPEKTWKNAVTNNIAETDTIFPEDKRHESERILKDMGSIPYQMVLYSGVEHGFAVRGDLNKPEIKFAKEAAFIQAVQWFDEFLKKDRKSAS
jgi:dienelactone hydrolase